MGGYERDTSGVNDAELIERSLVDGASFALLFDRHFRTIHRFLCGRVGSQLAEDLSAETFAIAFRRRSAYDSSRLDALPWLYGIAINVMRGHRRSEERRLRADARAAADGGTATDGVDPPLDETVASALLALSEQDRNLVLLFAWAGLSYDQLAEALGIPLGTVASRLNRARSRLRSSLGPVLTPHAGERT